MDYLKRMKTCAVLGLVSLIFILTAGPAGAKSFPSRPINIVVPYSAGGGTDLQARALASVADQYFGQPVVVSTKPGGGGAVGTSYVAQSRPDGYTLLLAASTSLLWPPLTQNVEYDLDSFDYVGQITEFQQAIVAKADASVMPLETRPGTSTASGRSPSGRDRSKICWAASPDRA